MTAPPLTVGGRLGEYVDRRVRRARRRDRVAARVAHRASPETVDVSMLEAMQITMLTIVPTLMARFPGGRLGSFRFVMIPGNEPTGDGRFVGITTVTEQQWKALARVIGRDDMADDDELGTMIGRFMRGRRSERRAARAGPARTPPRRSWPRACEARVPATIVGNGAELPAFDHVIERDVFVPQPGEPWMRPRAPFRFHGVPDRELDRAAPRPTDPTRGRHAARTPRRRRGRATARSRA